MYIHVKEYGCFQSQFGTPKLSSTQSNVRSHVASHIQKAIASDATRNVLLKYCAIIYQY